MQTFSHSSSVWYPGKQYGNYQLLKLLGQGGFAEVYLGEHIYLHTPAAIKIVRSLDEFDVNTFFGEARLAARLYHPHIVRVLDFDMEGEVPFLVMDYAPNGSVGYRYPAGSQPPIPVILEYVKQIADALHYIHNRNLIHRDIKPENLLLNQKDQVLLSDFGIAIAAHKERTGEQAPIGTANYMAPEQIEGHCCLGSDQYSLGVVVYEWLCGSRPFQGSMGIILNQHLSAKPPSLCQRVPDLPEAVEEVVFRALAKDPGQRFESVQAFAVGLHHAFKKKTVGWTKTIDNSLFHQLSVVPSKKKTVIWMDHTPEPEIHHSNPATHLQASHAGRSSQKKRGGARKRKVSKDIIICYTIDLLAYTFLGSILYWLSLAPLLGELLIAFCMVLLPIGYALVRKNRILLGLSCSLTGVAIALALLAQAPALFVALYTILLILSLLITLSVRINGM
jgi:serine/threonine protein kinase